MANPLSSHLSLGSSVSYSSLFISISAFFFSFLSLFLCACVFLYASLISLYFHLDLWASDPSLLSFMCFSPPSYLCFSLSVSLCESFLLSQPVSLYPSLLLSLSVWASLFLRPPPSLFCIIRPAPASSLSQPSGRGSDSRRGGSSWGSSGAALGC